MVHVDSSNVAAQIKSESSFRGEPVPLNPKLLTIYQLIQNSDFENATVQLEALQTFSTLDILWKKYLFAILNFGKDDFQQGLSSLNDCIKLRKPNFDPEELRVLGLCLKKMGWAERKTKKYAQAFIYHQERLQIALKVGSPFEVHDAYLSLDVDAYFLSKPYMSEFYLKESIKYGRTIEDKISRLRALAMSNNNLAGTSYEIEKFDQAVDVIYKALDLWKAYEAEVGYGENRVLWAHFGIGDVFQHYAEYQAKLGVDFEANKLVAVNEFQIALDLGKQRQLPEGDLNTISSRINAVHNIVSFSESF